MTRAGLAAAVALLGTFVGCLAAQRQEGTSQMEIALPQVIENLAAHLVEGNASVSSVSAQLGPVSEKYSGSGYFLAPTDRRIASIWAAVHQDNDGEWLSNVDIDFQGTTLTMADLDQKFGRNNSDPPAPSGALYCV